MNRHDCPANHFVKGRAMCRVTLLILGLLPWATFVMAQERSSEEWSAPEIWKLEQVAQHHDIAWLAVRDGWLFWAERSVVPGTEQRRVQTLDVALYRRRLADKQAERIATLQSVGSLPGLHPGPNGTIATDLRGREAHVSRPEGKSFDPELEGDDGYYAPWLLMADGIFGHVHRLNKPLGLAWIPFESRFDQAVSVGGFRQLSLGETAKGHSVRRTLNVDSYARLMGNDQYLVWSGEIAHNDKRTNVAATVVWDRHKRREAWWHTGRPVALSDDHVFSQPHNWQAPDRPWLVRRRAKDGAEAQGWRDSASIRWFIAADQQQLIVLGEADKRQCLYWYDLAKGKRSILNFGWGDMLSPWGFPLDIRLHDLRVLQLQGPRRAALCVTDFSGEQFLVAVGKKIYHIPFTPLKTDHIEVTWQPYAEDDDSF